MKSAKLFTLVIVALPVLAVFPAWGQGNNQPAGNHDGRPIEQQIKALHEQRREAALRGDASFFEKNLAADYMGSGADGRLVTKDQEVQMVKSGAIKYEAIDERDVNVRVYGGTAIVNALASVNLSSNGRQTKGDQRVTSVWVRQEGDWKLASFQATRVTPLIPRPGDNLGHDARPATP